MGYIWTGPVEECPEEPREVTVTYETGMPVDVDGIKAPVQMITYLNEVGSEHGVGRIDILEDGMIGLKPRKLYEAPAATILLGTHADLEHLTLTKEQLRLKHEVDRIWADMVYHAMWLHPLRKDLDSFINSTQKHVNGKLHLKLHKGNMEIARRESPDSLFAPELRSIKKGGFDQRQSTGAVSIYSLPFRLYGERRR